MTETVRRSCIAALLTCAAAAPACAGTVADLQTKLDRALRHTKSFVVTTTYPAQAYTSTLVFVAPNKTRVAVAVSADTTDIVTIGATTYSSKNGAPFERAAVPAGQVKAQALPAVRVAALGGDRSTGGITYGTFQTTVPFGKLVTLTCLYDKRTYRVARCANDEVTQTYNSYDDPQNVVEAPANAVDAPTPVPTKGGR